MTKKEEHSRKRIDNLAVKRMEVTITNMIHIWILNFWAGKKQHTSFDFETVSLHIHEKVSTKAIMNTVLRKPEWTQTTLKVFAEPELPLDKRIEFYRHDIDWSNRLILGDSMLIMNSLIECELMKSKLIKLD